MVLASNCHKTNFAQISYSPDIYARYTQSDLELLVGRDLYRQPRLTSLPVSGHLILISDILKAILIGTLFRCIYCDRLVEVP